jgi:transforming growth factor-beta-induced protein
MKSLTQLLSIFAIAVLGSMTFISCDKDDEEEPAPKNIVEVAASNPDFSILVQAVNKAGFASLLSGPGPFTVFAPTNAAFTSLLTELGASSLDSIPVPVLQEVLLYHVVSGKVPSSAVATGYVPTNANGPGGSKVTFYVNKTGSTIKIDNRATITATDIEASNGVIHVIDKVILPSKIVAKALADDSFSSLVAALVYAELVDAVNGDGPFTVFAPTNTAFANLLTVLGAGSITDVEKSVVQAVLLDHVVSGNVRSSALANGNVPTLGGENIVVSGLPGTPKLNGDINITAVDIQGTNGVFHRIDKVIVN